MESEEYNEGIYKKMPGSSCVGGKRAAVFADRDSRSVVDIEGVRISCDGTAVSNPYDGRDKQGNNAVGSGGSDRNGSR